MTHVFGNDSRTAVADGLDVAPVPDGGGSGHPGHEQVVFCQDPPTGLRAIIAIYSTRLGPGLGGTRFYPYPSEDAALADALNLSRAMAYKNALAGLDLGGGKAVIIGDPARLKSEALLRAYGRFVESLNGRYITACDVGTYSEDMDIIARECTHVTGTHRAEWRSRGFLRPDGLRRLPGHARGRGACLGQHQPGGQTVRRRGRGQGRPPPVGHLVDADAQVTICDVDAGAVERVRARNTRQWNNREPDRTCRGHDGHLFAVRARRVDRR